MAVLIAFIGETLREKLFFLLKVTERHCRYLIFGMPRMISGCSGMHKGAPSVQTYTTAHG